jgi:Cephalosporin hydroxylase
MELFELSGESNFPLEWQMCHGERFVLISLLKQIKPKFSLEVGTYRGGSLQVISRFSEKVITVDDQREYSEELRGHFNNVQFEVGESARILPRIVQEINESEIPLEFILLDGDHRTEYVRADIANILQIKPKKRIVILMHDAFNPSCREGIRTAPWSSCPYVSLVELDFVHGLIHTGPVSGPIQIPMWGGFACAVLEPYPIPNEKCILKSNQRLHDVVKEAYTSPISLEKYRYAKEQKNYKQETTKK